MRTVPFVFVLTATVKGSLNLTVAATWNTIFTFSINMDLSAGERPVWQAHVTLYGMNPAENRGMLSPDAVIDLKMKT